MFHRLKQALPSFDLTDKPDFTELVTAARRNETRRLSNWLQQNFINQDDLHQVILWAIEWDHKIALETVLQVANLASHHEGEAIGLAIVLGNTRLLPILLADTTRTKLLRRLIRDYNLKSTALDPAFSLAARTQAKLCYNAIMNRLRQLKVESDASAGAPG